MQYSLGLPSPMEYVARHFAKRAPRPRYSSRRPRRPSSPSVTVSPSANASGFAPLSTLMPGMIPFDSSSFGNGVPSADVWRIVSSKRMTPLMNSSAPSVVKSMSRYARRFSSVDSTPIESNRFLIVPADSSAARIPFPKATSALAVSFRSFPAMASSVVLTGGKYLLRSGARRGLAAAVAPPLRVRSLRDAALDPGGDPESVAARFLRFLPHPFQD